MKRLLILIPLLTLLISQLCAQSEFITTWQTTTDNENITIPTYSGETYSYDVNWGDGSSDTGVTGDATHQYSTTGTYSVSITGTFPRIYFNDTGDKAKIMTIEQWGNIQWSSMQSAFNGCSNLTYNATDIPDLSNVTSMSGMFNQCSSFNGDIGNWDVSKVIYMRLLFGSASSFNQPIGNWDTGSAIDMSYMFNKATNFNADISNWNVSNVITMEGMFDRATNFNSDISNWDVSNVTSMDYMFDFATSFNSDVSEWDVSNVTSMSAMFYIATSFNKDISNWNVSKVTNMDVMFGFASSFNRDISNWDVSSVTNMYGMLNSATAFNQDLSNWNISNVWNMSYMLDNSGLSSGNYDLLLEGWLAQTVKNNVTLGASGLAYCSASDARNTLINTYGWTINGDTQDCSQTITFDALPDVEITNPGFDLFATSSANLSVTYTSSNTAVATIDGSTLTVVGIGITTITATQPGDIYYSAATPVEQTLTVTKASQTITFDAIDDQLIEDGTLTLSATASSGLGITYTIISGPATVSGSAVTFTDMGTVTLEASQNGNETYSAATPVEQTFDIITVTGIADTFTGKIYFYPNPVTDKIFVEGEILDINQIDIVDLNGKQILSKKNNVNEIDVSHIKSGQYILRIITSDNIYTQQIIKQ